ncbi:MAG: tryptophan synthase subunit beta like protein [Venatoribacter sp.]
MYIKRDANGRICAVNKTPDSGYHFIEDNSPELTDFYKLELLKSDTDLARILEDLIDLLSRKGLIQFTDLPSAAQLKLLNRKSNRRSVNKLELIKDEFDDGGIPL